MVQRYLAIKWNHIQLLMLDLSVMRYVINFKDVDIMEWRFTGKQITKSMNSIKQKL